MGQIERRAVPIPACLGKLRGMGIKRAQFLDVPERVRREEPLFQSVLIVSPFRNHGVPFAIGPAPNVGPGPNVPITEPPAHSAAMRSPAIIRLATH